MPNFSKKKPGMFTYAKLECLKNIGITTAKFPNFFPETHRVVRVERERVSPADLEGDQLAGGDGLEHGHHVVVGEPQHAGVVHVHQDVAWGKNKILI